MSEVNAVSKIRKSYDDYIKLSKKEISDLKSQNTILLHKFAFYLFEYNLIKGTLTDTIKSVFDINNKDSKRLEFIMTLKNTKVMYEQLPVEIKMIIKEVIL